MQVGNKLCRTVGFWKQGWKWYLFLVVFGRQQRSSICLEQS